MASSRALRWELPGSPLSVFIDPLLNMNLCVVQDEAELLTMKLSQAEQEVAAISQEKVSISPELLAGFRGVTGTSVVTPTAPTGVGDNSPARRQPLVEG